MKLAVMGILLSAPIALPQSAPAPTLQNIHKVFIEPMPNNLDLYLREQGPELDGGQRGGDDDLQAGQGDRVA